MRFRFCYCWYLFPALGRRRSPRRWKSRSSGGFSVRAEGEHVLDIGTDGLYNDGADNGVGDRPTIADPEGGELNQLYAKFENEDLLANVGKQEIVLDDERFIGNVGWRQNDGEFQTPLATLHLFNGWADKFLSTPVSGLQDTYLALIAKTGPVSWKGSFHDFSSDVRAIDYGTELDLQVSYKTPWEQTIAVTGAFYDADRFSTDTTKIWIWTSWGM